MAFGKTEHPQCVLQEFRPSAWRVAVDGLLLATKDTELKKEQHESEQEKLPNN